MTLEKPLQITQPPPGLEPDGKDHAEWEPILKILEDGPKTIDEITDTMNITRRALRKQIKKLLEKGSIGKEPRRPPFKKRGRPKLQYFIKTRGNILESTTKIIPKAIWLICPSCNATGRIKVDKELLEQCAEEEGSGLIDVQVFQGDVCEHDFSVKVDCRLKVRSAYTG